ncbi:potassium/proton antiporter [Pokkaliibacter plantistimulans]|uniref:Potassium/proton antiporter n=1 Tax=Pokkaliibacter plantistimulans TaxID=1635171 RepID=A0ABX5LW18_9GAMM|nr:potassium/proton antiporter [Pokkaliibacter plantistimulans]PXF30852.1 potassium/proton antiporter [Pokkaliibacter plantistimulans]
MTASTLLLIGAMMITLSILLSPLSNRLGVPVLLLFLVVGMLSGEEGPGGIQFNDVNTSFLVGNLALAIILLDGGMRTRVATFRVGLKPALMLATFGVVITAVITGLVAMWVFHLSLLSGLLIGTMVSSTDAAVVFALLQGKGLNLNERVGATLEIESGSNDPMAIFLTMLLISLIGEAGHVGWFDSAMLLIKQFGIGVVAGAAAGYVLAWLIMNVTLTLALYPLLVTAFGLVVFSATNELGGSGFLAIYLCGVVVGNRKLKVLQDILHVHDGLAWLAQLVLFLILGLLVTPSNLLVVAPGALLIALVLTFFARPLSVWLGLLPFHFRWREVVFISWVGLRGAVPIVLALFPFMAGVQEAYLMFNVAFVVVLFSLIIQGSSLSTVARWLKLEVPAAYQAERVYPLDLKEAGDFELYVFRLRGKRWQTPRFLRDLALPKATGVAAVFRDGRYLPVVPDLAVKEEDLLALVAQESDLPRLSERLTAEQKSQYLQELDFFGEFLLNGDARLSDVQQAYGVTVPDADPAMTLSECIISRFHGHPVVGDKLELGPITLIVKGVSGDQVTSVGLKLNAF